MIPRKQIVLHRREKGSYVNGVYQPGSVMVTSIRASVQPTTPDDLISLPEGRRTKESYRLYTSDSVNTQSKTHDPDLVILYGEEFEILHVFRWENGLINHKKALAVKLENPS